MNENTPRDEPSTEEILESIRQAVEEGAAAGEPQQQAHEDASEILELTQEIREDGSVVDTETGATVVGGSADGQSRP